MPRINQYGDEIWDADELAAEDATLPPLTPEEDAEIERIAAEMRQAAADADAAALPEPDDLPDEPPLPGRGGHGETVACLAGPPPRTRRTPVHRRLLSGGRRPWWTILLSWRHGNRTGTVRACPSGLRLDVDTPFRLGVSTGHIPHLVLGHVRYVEDGRLTEYGVRRVQDLFHAASRLARAALARRAEVEQALADLARRAAPFDLAAEDAHERFLRVRRDTRAKLRRGEIDQHTAQNVQLRPAREAWTRARSAAWQVRDDFDRELGNLLGLHNGCACFETQDIVAFLRDHDARVRTREMEPR